MRLALIGLLCALGAPVLADDWSYRAQLSEHGLLEVQVCAPPAHLLALVAEPDAVAHLRADVHLWEHESRTLMRWVGAGNCGHFEVDLGALADRRQRGQGYRIGPDLLLWPAALLWWPSDPEAGIDLRLTLPKGWHASLPWPQRANGHYRLGGTPRSWPGLIAVGPLQIQRLPIGRSTVELAVLGGLPDTERERMRSWVAHSAGLLQQVGGLPVPQVQVLVVPIPGAGGPVPWGQNTRAGQGGVHFFVRPEQHLQAFIDDWTAAHEFSHLLHPYLGDDRWMGEGLASYYQNVLRARSGDLSADQAWENLLAGFERGRRDAAQGVSLETAAADMRRRHAYMRVYWSGAAYWLQADVELRRRSQGRQSLDTALNAYARCCLPARRSWSALEFAGQLDHLTGEKLFAPAARAAAEAMRFPDLDPLYARLGLLLDGERRYAGRRDAELAAVREAIFEGRGW